MDVTQRPRSRMDAWYQAHWIQTFHGPGSPGSKSAFCFHLDTLWTFYSAILQNCLSGLMLVGQDYIYNHLTI